MPFVLSVTNFDLQEHWDPVAWQKRIADQERAKLAAEWLPSTVKTVLDVGCGNGVFTNLVEPLRLKVGLDMSRVALANVTAPHTQANAAQIPFADNSFDATVCMELLEHLSLIIHKAALDELLRVSRRYVLITVPYNENLSFNQVICPQCLCKFHPDHHIRTYTSAILEKLLGPKATLLRLNPVVPTKRKLLPGVWNLFGMYMHRRGSNYPPGTVCPQCGFGSSNSAPSKITNPQLHSFRHSIGNLWPQTGTFTWWIALYEIRDLTA